VSARSLRRAFALALFALLGAGCEVGSSENPDLPVVDPFAGDPIDPETGVAAEIVPGAPWIQPGPDEEYGSADDVFVPGVVGDVDLVVRVRPAEIGAGFPAPAPLRAVQTTAIARPFSMGAAIPFAAAFADFAGAPVAPEFMRGLPLLVLAFADLDDDGYVGRTHRDGETRDTALETLELYPIGRRYAVPRGKVAEGTLSVGLGGPLGVSVALGAAAIAAPFENPNLPCVACHSWPSPAADVLLLPFVAGSEVAPQGAVAMTHLPFLPDTDVDYRDAPRGLVPAHPDARVGVLVEIALLPNPGDPRVGEAFTLPLDGSSPSIDVARAISGKPRRFALAQPVDPLTWRPTPGRIVRPGLGDAGESRVVEIVQRTALAARTAFRVVPVDELGNVAASVSNAPIALRADGDVRIVAPDLDGDPLRETIAAGGTAGRAIELESAVPDGVGSLLIDAPEGIARVEFGPVTDAFLFPSDVLFPPDNDGDGIGGPPGNTFTLDDDDDEGEAP
jgi:hypothetical protein